MSFLAKFKKKSGATVSKTPATTEPPQLQPEVPATQKEYTPPPEPPSPAHAVEIDSIFTGLKLSAQVASKEGDESPYLQRNISPRPQDAPDDSEDAPSSFSFLKQDPPPDQSPEVERSSFGFISGSQETPQEEPSGFSFMQKSHDTEQESRDTKQGTLGIESQSHNIESQPHVQPPEIITEPQDPPIKSHDKDTKSHDVKQHSPATKTPQKLAPTLVKKKKKKRAVRPGHASKEEPHESDSISLNSHTSSLDSSQYDGVPLSPDRVLDVTQSCEQHMEQLVDIDSNDLISSTTDEKITLTQEVPKEIMEPSNTTQEESKDKKVSEVTEEVDDNTKSKDTTGSKREGSEMAVQDEVTTKATSPDEGLSEELAQVFSQRPNYSLELSARDTLTVLLEGFESGLAGIRSGQSVEELRSAVADAVSIARGQVEKRKLAAVLRSQQSQALTDEDYELAEQLHQQLEETKLTQEHHITATALEAVSRWLVQCQETDENEITFRGDMQSKMAALQEEQTNALAQLDKEHASLIAKDKMKLQAMEDTLEREKGHIALDREHLERREHVLSDEVHRRAVDFISRKHSLEEELTTVKDEIASLEEKLASLKAQETSIIGFITEQEEKITSIEEELATEKSQLTEEMDAIAVKEEEHAKQQEKLVEEKACLACSHQELSTSREGLANLVTRAQTVTDEFERKVAGLKRAKAETNGLLSLDGEGRTLLIPSDKLTRLLERVGESSSSVDSLTSGVLSTQSELSAQRKELSDLEAQVPQLNDAKKTAVTGRQFKEAARIASEVKTITGRVEEVKQQISDSETKLAGLNKELTQHSEELEAVKNEADAQEKEEDKVHLTALLVNLRKLREVKGQLDSSSLSEVVGQWVELYSLLADNLAVKHVWKLKDFTPVPSEDSTAEPTVEKVPLEEERTPGVGREEVTTPTNEEIAVLEKQIEEACELENYDKAAELEEKLTLLKAGAKTQN